MQIQCNQSPCPAIQLELMAKMITSVQVYHICKTSKRLIVYVHGIQSRSLVLSTDFVTAIDLIQKGILTDIPTLNLTPLLRLFTQTSY